MNKQLSNEGQESGKLFSLDEYMVNMKPRTWYGEIWWWIRYGIWNWIGYNGEVWRYIKRFWQRGIRGYGDSDVWSLHYYLADVIFGTTKSLRDKLHGHPCDLDPKKWREVLEYIMWTFDTSLKISEGEWWYLEPERRTECEMNKLKNMVKDLEKKHKTSKLDNTNYHVMDYAECERYEKGWDLFRKYFFSLWD